MKNPKYKKDMKQQIYEEFNKQLVLSQSKFVAKKEDDIESKIFSVNTFKTYRRQCNYFANWVKINHPKDYNLRHAKKYVREYLYYREKEYKSKNGESMSPHTMATQAAALNKLYGISKDDPNRYVPPVRLRSNITRSRGPVANDRNFNPKTHWDLVAFAQSTGLRRGGMTSIRGRDLFTKEEIYDRHYELNKRTDLSNKEKLELKAIEDTRYFRGKYDFYVRVVEKGGKLRYAPIVTQNEKEKEMILEKFHSIKPDAKVWPRVSSAADIHSYRADYASRLYEDNARDVTTIDRNVPFYYQGHKYKNAIYTCRKDEKGVEYDREAMIKVSKALGHNRIDTTISSYIRR